jgi:hypothetical protein
MRFDPEAPPINIPEDLGLNEYDEDEDIDLARVNQRWEMDAIADQQRRVAALSASTQKEDPLDFWEREARASAANYGRVALHPIPARKYDPNVFQNALDVLGGLDDEDAPRLNLDAPRTGLVLAKGATEAVESPESPYPELAPFAKQFYEAFQRDDRDAMRAALTAAGI